METSSSAISFEAPPEAADLELVALALRAREAVSSPGRALVDLRSIEPDPAVVEAALLGRRVCVRLHGARGVARSVRGVVTRVSLRGHAADGLHARYRVRVEPALALLGRTRASRIFQDLSVPEVIDEITAGHPLVSLAWHLTGAYAPRPYCVQHQESDLAFVERLLAEEGIRYHVDHDPPGVERTGERVVLTDAASFARAIEGDATLVYREAERSRDEETVTRFVRHRSVRPGRFSSREYDWLLPERPRVAEASVPRAGERFDEASLERYDHHVEHDEARVARDTAALALQQTRRRAEVMEATCACPRLAPGRSFSLEAPAMPTLEGDYTVVAVEHRAEEPEAADGEAAPRYEARALVVTRGGVVRPARPARRVQQVLETATVTGPPGEEVWTDEHGRIKVQFHWDRDGRRDEHSSCWIRTMQAWAGAAYGAQFIPRVGSEVIVSFIGGDTDRPVVLGCLYNGTHTVPFTLPERRTRSGLRTRSSPGGEGYNELSFEDAAGQEELRLHAARDLRETVRHDHGMIVDGSSTVTVGGDRTETVGANRVETVRGERVVTVMGGETLLVLGDRREGIDGDSERSVRGDETSAVAGAVSVQVGGAVDISLGGPGGEADTQVSVGGSWRASVQEDVVIQATRSITFVCGDNRLEVDREGVTIRAKRIELAAVDEVVVRTDDASLTLDDDAELTADAVKLYGPGSRLELTGEATLRGGKVHLGQGGGKAVQFAPPDEREAVFRFVQNRAREPIAGARVRIRHPDGSEREHVTDAGGYVRIRGAAQALYEVLGVADGARDFVRRRTRRS